MGQALIEVQRILERSPHPHPSTQRAVREEIEQVVALLEIDLAAAQHELNRMIDDRDAVRRYLQVDLETAADKVTGNGPTSMFRRELLRLMDQVGTDRKIQLIKEVRANTVIHSAWLELGNTNNTNGSRDTIPLKDAKDIVDHACYGVLWKGVQGGEPLQP